MKRDMNPVRVGASVIVRSVMFFYTGRVVSIDETWLVLSDAAWIADTGRWSEALKTGSLGEVEPYPDVVAISKGAIVDVSTWSHTLPRGVK